MRDLMYAGAARADITPPIGVPTGGGGPEGYVKTQYVLDPLYARALFLSAEDHTLLLLQPDLLGLSRPKSDRICALIADVTGIPAGDIIIICPQTHNAGCTFGDFPADESMKFVSTDHQRWYESLDRRLAVIAAAARENIKPVVASVVRGRCDNVCSNRRALMKSGKVRMSWYDPKPVEIVSWGTADNEVVLVKLVAQGSGMPVAVLWHFTGHPNSVWMLPCFSRDYPGVVEDMLVERYPGMVPLFINGYCGDVEPFRCMGVGSELYTYPYYKEPGRDLQPNIDAMRRLGGILGKSVLELWDSNTEKEFDRFKLNLARRDVDCQVLNQPSVFQPQVGVAAFRIGPVGFGCAPFEPVNELGVQVKKRSPASCTVTVGHAPYYTGYLPDRRTVQEGEFEAETSWRGYADGTGEKIVDAVIECLRQVFPQ